MEISSGGIIGSAGGSDLLVLTNQAETDAPFVPGIRFGLPAVSRAQTGKTVIPGAAPEYTVAATIFLSGAPVTERALTVIPVPAIQNPFPDVTVDVAKTPGIRRLLAYRMRFGTRACLVPGVRHRVRVRSPE